MSQDTSAPFAQLFSVHAFIKKDGKLKQVPLAFVLVSRRRRKDYVRVLRTLMDVMPQRSVVQAVVSDFESALWSAVSKVHGATWRLSPRLHFPLLPGVVAQYPGRWVAGSVHVRRRRQSRLSIDYGTAISAGECDRRRIREGAAGQQ